MPLCKFYRFKNIILSKGEYWVKPIIGITCSYKMGGQQGSRLASYVMAVETAGGVPLILVPLRDTANLEYQVELIDGLLLTGGVDIDPRHYGEEPHQCLGTIEPDRDGYEIPLTRRAVEKKMPLLGICRGMQIMNVALGGSLHQDIATALKRTIKHRQEAPNWYATHSIVIEENTNTQRILGAKSIRVNSFHHQAINKPGEDLIVAARSETDGVVEAIEGTGNLPFLGVQWHPEALRGEESSTAIFHWFISAAGGYSRKQGAYRA